MYDLHLLGWRDFQNLCHTILREILGQTVERFLDSKDGGRDGGFAGVWKSTGQEDLSGRYVVQCKHTSRASSSLSLRPLKDELDKATRLVEAGHCDSYIVMTNYGISGVIDEQIKGALRKIGVKYSRNLGNNWLVQQITESSRLRMLVPRVYGLGDLSQILDERGYEQAKVLLESMHDDMSKVVVTAAYGKAVDAVEKHGFVLLVGDPGSGKSTVASLLAMTAGDRWKSSVLKAANAEEFKARWNPHDRNQFFWIDDAFGTTQYEPALAQLWNRHFPEANAAIKRGSKILMTSRNYIYKSARSDLKRSAFPFLDESQVVVNVHELITREREQILYNHLKLGHQSKFFKASVKPYLSEVAALPSFLPETVRRFSDPTFTKRVTFDRSAIVRFFDNPSEWLAEVISTLDTDARAAVALIHGGRGHVPNPIPDADWVNQALKRFGSSVGGVSKAMVALQDSLVRLTTTDKGQHWTFQHPSMEDAFSLILRESSDLLDIYLDTASLGDVATRISCGGGDSENSIQVPPFLYPVVINRLGRKHPKPAGVRLTVEEQIEYFLARRTSDEFLRLFFESAGWLFETLAEVSAPFAASQLELAARLRSAGLLPEGLRASLSERVVEAILDCDDPEVLSHPAVRQILTTEELESLRERLAKEVLPYLSQRWKAWRHSIIADDEYVASAFSEYLDALETELRYLPGVTATTGKQREAVDNWLAEKETEDEGGAVERRYGTYTHSPDSSRSTFDDLDD